MGQRPTWILVRSDKWDAPVFYFSSFSPRFHPNDGVNFLSTMRDPSPWDKGSRTWGSIEQSFFRLDHLTTHVPSNVFAFLLLPTTYGYKRLIPSHIDDVSLPPCAAMFISSSLLNKTTMTDNLSRADSLKEKPCLTLTT